MKAALLIILASFFANLTVGQQKASRRGCTMQELQRCMQFLQPVTESNDSALPTTREDLNSVCSELRSGVKCIDRHTRDCFSQEQTMVFKDLVSPAREFISQLCEEGPTQNEFLRHAKCYRNMSTDAEKCAIKYKTAVSVSTNATQAQNTELSMKRSCCALREFVHCKYRYVGQDCGARAEAFMKNHLDKITNPILESHCTAYIYGSAACRFSAGSQSELSGEASSAKIHGQWPLAIWLLLLLRNAFGLLGQDGLASVS